MCIYDPIEKNIINELNKLNPAAPGLNLTDPEWTSAIKGILAKLGHQEGCKVATSPAGIRGGRDFAQLCQAVQGHKPDHTEWLYDILWYQDYPDNLGYLLDVLLVAESEWSSKDYVKDDFQKLLLARSKYRIMIYQCETDGTVIRWAKEQIRNFKLTQQGDRYLFCS